MLVDQVTLEYIVEYADVLAMNYDTIKSKVHNFVCERYQEDYNYGAEYYFDYKVVNFQDTPSNMNKRVIITLQIFKDKDLDDLQKNATKGWRLVYNG